MSPAGFVTSTLTAKQLIHDLPSFASALSWLGMAVALLGLTGIIYVVILLTSSYQEGTDGFTTRGIYSFVRHPLYLSGIIFNFGVLICAESAHGWTCIQIYFLDIVGIICYILAARAEDSYNIAKFGNRYRRYAERVPGLNLAKNLFPPKSSNR